MNNSHKSRNQVLAGLIASVPILGAVLVLTGLYRGGPALWFAFAMLLFVLVGRPRRRIPFGGNITIVPAALAILHFIVLGAAVSFLPNMTAGQAFLGFMTTGLYLGHVSVPAAHELIHRGQKPLFWLGAAIYISLLFGHHSSSHRLIHHVFVGTAHDPNTAGYGQSIFRFLPRAWLGSFIAGLNAEKRRANAGVLATPYPVYVLGGLVSLFCAFAISGLEGVAFHGLLALYATTQLLTSDYVQHYGLSRRLQDNGRPEPISPLHSWDAPPGPADMLMLNSPHHARHHVQPILSYAELSTPSETPVLPYSLTVMGMLAYAPPLWRRVMHPRLAARTNSATQDRA